MNPCPHCQEPVLEMAQKCRHCGQEIDEATFFMNESAMMEEIQALQKQTAELQERKRMLKRQFQFCTVAAVILLLGGGGLVAFAAQSLMQGLGAAHTIIGVLAVFLALKARRELETLNSKTP